MKLNPVSFNQRVSNHVLTRMGAKCEKLRSKGREDKADMHELRTQYGEQVRIGYQESSAPILNELSPEKRREAEKQLLRGAGQGIKIERAMAQARNRIEDGQDGLTLGTCRLLDLFGNCCIDVVDNTYAHRTVSQAIREERAGTL